MPKIKYIHAEGKTINVIGIDPGAKGGITLITENNVTSRKCPDTPESMASAFMLLLESVKLSNTKVCMEFVHAFPTDSRRSAFKFGTNYGIWRGIVASYDLHYAEVSPQKWIKYYNIGKLTKLERKRALKERAIELFPNLKVTFNISDSLLIANYAKREMF